MAIIEKDGFQFLDDTSGRPEAFIITGENLEKEINYINQLQVKSIYLTFFKSKKIHNLSFLKKINHVEKINLNDLDVDYSDIYNLEHLKYAILTVKNKNQHLDYSRFLNLEYLSIDWYPSFPNLSDNHFLKSVVLWKFRPKTKNFTDIKLPKNLENLEITESNLVNLEGLTLKYLKKLECHHCNSLISLEGINIISSSLQVLILDYCRKLIKYDNLTNCVELQKIILSDCGPLPTISWLKDLRKVKHFSFWGTNLLDGDTSPCFGIDYVSFKNSKEYNYKMEDFKQI